MATGPEFNENKYRNMRLGVQGLATDFGAATATAEAATLNDLMGIVTTNALDAAADATETIVITNNRAAAGDVCIAQVIGGTSAGLPVVLKSVCTASTITITILNVGVADGGDALDGTVIIGYVLIKALSGL
jgi:hypothetical protein